MSTRKFTRNSLALVKAETTYGALPSPAPAAANAIRITGGSINPMEGSVIELAYLRGYVGSNPSMRASHYLTCQLEIDLAGSGTAGTAPGYDALLRAAGLAKTVFTELTGTPQTNGQTPPLNEIKLASGASATNNLYSGMRITITFSGGDEIKRIISYNGSTKVAVLDSECSAAPETATGYTIAASTYYKPVDLASCESAAIYYTVDGLRHVGLGMRGSMQLNLSGNEKPGLTFNGTALWGGVSDQTDTGTFSGWADPLPVNSTNTSALVRGKSAAGGTSGIQLQKWNLDVGNSITHRQLVGSENVILTDRKAKGSLSLEMTSVAFHDWHSDVNLLTKDGLLIVHGSVSGNRVAIWQPNVQFNNLSYSDSDGIVMAEMPYDSIPLTGNDEFKIIFE